MNGRKHNKPNSILRQFRKQIIHVCLYSAWGIIAILREKIQYNGAKRETIIFSLLSKTLMSVVSCNVDVNSSVRGHNRTQGPRCNVTSSSLLTINYLESGVAFGIVFSSQSEKTAEFQRNSISFYR